MAPNSKEKETGSCESEWPTEIKKQNIFDMDLHHQMPSKSSGCFSIDLSWENENLQRANVLQEAIER